MAFPPFLGRHLILGFKGPEERKIVVEAGESGDFADGAGGCVCEISAGQEQAFADNVLAHAVAGDSFETMHEMGTADVGTGGETVDREAFRQMVVDIGQKSLYFFVGDGGGSGIQFAVDEGAV